MTLVNVMEDQKTGKNQDQYFNRELSWLRFNSRVLAEAMDSSNPVLERLKFLGIVSSNFDEFFMVRMASLNESESLLKELYGKAGEIIRKQEDYFVNIMVPELEKAGILRIPQQALSDRQKDYVKNLFYRELFPLLTPIAIREDQPVPVLVGLSVYCATGLIKPAEPGIKHYAVIQIPKNYPRMISLPMDQGYGFILLEDLIGLFAKELFIGYEIVEQGLLRVTRAAELTLDEEKDEDFAKVMTEALRLRRHSHILRMEISGSEEMKAFFKKKLDLEEHQIYQTQGWFDLKGISQLAFQAGFEELKRPAWTPRPVLEFEETENIWDLLKERDVIVYHPYESFDAFNRFLAEAAQDPDVLAIKQTLYRAGGQQSPVLASLEKAAEKGKQVTVLVELKARFDEEHNIEWARRLENAGASVLYGVAGFKTHAKLCLIIRREAEGIRRYVHLGTGNYNEKTARLYSDIGYFTSHEGMTNDASAFFNVITGYSTPVGMSKIDIAPYTLRRKLERLIVREAMRSRKDQPGLIIAKMNSLVDPEIIEALYHASKAGVQIKLNVRGICCLKPGIKGLSENIEVTSIVDMFLEHSRMFYFYNGGDEELYLSSADWMQRNLNRRLEIMFPIENKKCKKDLVEVLKMYFKDNVKSWRLLPDGDYAKIDAGSEKKFRVQEYLCRRALDREAIHKKSSPTDLKPQRPKSE